MNDNAVILKNFYIDYENEKLFSKYSAMHTIHNIDIL